MWPIFNSHFFFRTPAAPLTNTALPNSILTLGRGNTIIRSAATDVGNLIANNITGNLLNFSTASDSLIRLNKTLGNSVGNSSTICTIQNVVGGYVVELDVVQSEVGATIDKKYQFSVRSNATGALFQRLVPVFSSHVSNTDWAVEVRVQTNTTTLRLDRVAGSVTANLECVLTVQQSRTDPVTVSSSITTANVSLSNAAYGST